MIKIIEIQDRNSTLIKELLEIWESSVRFTHLFLSDDEINNIKEFVPQALSDVPVLIIAENKKGKSIGFMGIADKMLEMLFISNENRRAEIGKQLLQYEIKKYSINEVTVNEQNPLAKVFYECMGFRTYKRTELDEQGNPYPLLYMKRD